MKISIFQITGIALVVAAALAIIVLQTSGHGMITQIDDPPTPTEISTHGDNLVRVVKVSTPFSFRLLKWTAIIGVIGIFIPRREKSNA